MAPKNNYSNHQTLRLAITTPFLLMIMIMTTMMTSTTLAAAADINVASLGAKSDGATDSSKAFTAAWAQACASTSPSTIYVPRGSFFLGESVLFAGPCKSTAITFKIDATLVAPANYNVLGNSAFWIEFRHVDGVSIYGGVLDGRGTGLWDCKTSRKSSCPTGATSLSLSNSKNIMVSGLASVNSQMFHMVINGCENVKVQGVKVTAAGNSPNTDGIHIQSSTGVTVLASKIATGDDCISIGPGARNLFLQNIACGPGHGISIGSLGKELNEAGVENVTVTTATFTGTQNGVRIKSWARASTGFARNILFQHAVMNNVENPIVIDQNYCPDNKNCPGEVSGVRISDVTYQDIHGLSATEVAVKFECSPKSPCSGIVMADVKLSYKNQLAATASCVHADGTAEGVVQPSSCL